MDRPNLSPLNHVWCVMKSGYVTFAHRRVIHAPGVGLEHFHDQGDDALGGVILAALLAFGQCELPQEVFVDMAEDVLAVQVQLFAVEDRLGKGCVGEGVDQSQQLVVVQLVLADTVENALQLDVALLDLFQSVVDQPGHRAQFYLVAGIVLPEHGACRQHGLLFQGAPAGGPGYPEDVGFAVVVEYFQLFLQGLLVFLIAAEIFSGQVIDVVVIVLLEELQQLFLALFKSVGYVFEEDQPQYHVLVVGSVQIGAELVGGFPEFVVQSL